MQRLYIVLRPESGERPGEEKPDPALSGKGSGSKMKNNNNGEPISSSGGENPTKLGGGDGDHEGGQGTQVR